VRTLAAFGIGAVFSVATVWVPAVASLTGFAWIIGAADAESPGCARGIRGSPTSD